MKRTDCWMTFSEALESYLSNRDARLTVGPGAFRNECGERMREAAEHMDALTAPVDLAELLRLRQTAIGSARLEVGALRDNIVEWQDVPLVGVDAPGVPT